MRLFPRPSCPQNALLLSRLLRPRAFPHIHVPRRIVTTSTTNTAPVDLPKLIITPGSVHHNSLPSFLDYANRTNLAPSKTYYVGTHYEYVAALSLLRLGFSLLRTGRKSDAGIDLIGHWVLPPRGEPLPIIVQCKARKISCNPSHIRELEGSFRGVPAEWRKKDVLGLLVTTQKATSGVLEALGMSRWPLGFVKITRDGTVEQFVWNRAASERGLEGVGVTLRHTPRALLPEIKEQGEEDNGWSAKDLPRRPRRKPAKYQNTGTKKDIQLTWMGSPIFPDREGLDQETLDLMGAMAHDEEKVVKKATRNPTIKPQRANVAKIVKKKSTRTTTSKASTRSITTSAKASTTAKKRGRPLGSKNKTMDTGVTKRGRPPGLKSKQSPSVSVEEAPKKRGRPRGSKNRAKCVTAAG